MPQAKLPARRPASAAGNAAMAVDSASCCEHSCKTSDTSQLNNERLDDIAFDNHLMESVYRKGSHNQL